MSKTTTTVAATVAAIPSADQYIAEYMARKLNGSREPKPGILERITAAVENKVIDTVADSKRVGGRVLAAWDAAGEGFDDAFALETKRQAERAAKRLGLR